MEAVQERQQKEEQGNRSVVLLVEDDPDARETLAELLTMHGFHVLEAKHGRAALDWLAFGPTPALIVTDLQMPVMDGWEFRAHQWEHHAWGSIPVVILSGSTEGLDENYLFRGAAVLPKPLRFEELLETLTRMRERSAGFR